MKEYKKSIKKAKAVLLDLEPKFREQALEDQLIIMIAALESLVRSFEKVAENTETFFSPSHETGSDVDND